VYNFVFHFVGSFHLIFALLHRHPSFHAAMAIAEAITSPVWSDDDVYYSCPTHNFSIIQLLREELDSVWSRFPMDSKPIMLCHALGYVLWSKYGWQVKFRCKHSIRSSSTSPSLPRFWLHDVLVVSPPECGIFVVDLCFKEKLSVRPQTPSTSDLNGPPSPSSCWFYHVKWAVRD
jgi:hypothetical protein